MIKFIVYCTTNLINKKIYVGVHKLESEKFDSYLGNGCYANSPSTYAHPKYAFQYAVKKYGPKNFKRITIKEFNNAEEAFLLEGLIVDKEFLKRKDVYNETLGGKGGDIAQLAIKVNQFDLCGNFIKSYNSYREASIENQIGWSVLMRASLTKHQSGGFFWSELEHIDIKEYHNCDNKIPVFEYSSNGLYNCCYESVSDAARCNKTSSGNLSRAIKTGYLCNNKHFSYIYETTYTKVQTTKYNKTKVYQYDLNGNFLNEFDNCTKAEQFLNVKKGLSNALKLGRTFAGYQWRRIKLAKIDSIEIKNTARKVAQYDLNGNLIKIFNTVSECQKEFSGCKHVLHGKRKTSGGYIFKYID